MDYFDAYEEVYAAIEHFVEESTKAPRKVNVSPALFRWLLEMKREAVTLHLEEAGEANAIQTRFGYVPIIIDEMLSPYEIIVE
jgi:hypothetical protein